MYRLKTVLGWLCSTYALLTTMLINSAGTPLSSDIDYHHLKPLNFEGCPILKIEVGFIDAPWAEYSSYTFWSYLNVQCAGAQADDTDESYFRQCIGRVGATQDIVSTLASVENDLYLQQISYAAYQNSYLTQSGIAPAPFHDITKETSTTIQPYTGISTSPRSGMTKSILAAEARVTSASAGMSSVSTTGLSLVPTAVPTGASSNISVAPFSFTTSFVFYFLGALSAAILFFIMPATFKGRPRWNFPIFSIALVSFCSLLIASSVTSYKANHIIKQLHSPSSSPYIISAATSQGFLGLAWSAVCAMFLTAACTGFEWKMGQKTGQRDL